MTNHSKWPRVALLAVTIASLGLVILLSLDLVGLGGLGPNLGRSTGYYGRFNRMLERVEASPNVEVLRTTLHRDAELEDFYITVRTQDQREVRLCFEEAHTRPFDELAEELKKAGI